MREVKRIDIDENPELLRLIAEVRASNEPRILRHASEDVAILTPPKPRRKRRSPRPPSAAAYEAFRSAAGGWKDVDTDKLIADIYADRALSDRPAVEL